jgi:hypothetical protein
VTKLLLVGFAVVMMANLRVEAPEKHLQIGDPFPVLSGQFLTGRDAALPQESSGSTRLVAMGFTYKSRFPVEAWAEWYSTAIGRREDITLFEVPMISGLATFGQWFIDRGMRNGTPTELHENVITVYSGANEWKTALAYGPGREDDAYLIVIDGGGIVQWFHHGMFDDFTAAQLRGVILSLARYGGAGRQQQEEE